MAKEAGRDVAIEIGGTPIAGVRVTSKTSSRSAIDTTDRVSGRHTEFLEDEFSEETMELTCSGVTDGTVLRDANDSLAAADKWFDNLTFVYPDGSSIGGTFFLSSYDDNGEYKDAMAFSATFTRSGEHTLAAAP